MKNNKYGFSLAEVLIAVTIAAIIATMGFSIAKKGVEKAYDRYIYNAYYSLSLVLEDAQSNKNLSMTNCPNTLGVVDGPNTCDFSKYIVQALSGRHVGQNPTFLTFDTPNGTNYLIRQIPVPSVPQRLNGEPRIFYLVRIQVPSVKKRNTNSKSVCAVYVENFLWNEAENPQLYETVLIPQGGFPACRRDINNDSELINDILDRKDLLAFYLDDGKRGQTINGQYNPRKFRNARELFCLKVNATQPLPANNGLRLLPEPIQCGMVQPGESWENERNTLIRITDPRRT